MSIMPTDFGARDPQLWAFITSLALPFLISIINKSQWTAFRKRCTAMLAIVTTAVFWVWMTQQVDPAQIAATLRTVLVTVGAIYALFKDPLKALEQKVNR